METNYPNLRQVLQAEYANLTDAELEYLFESAFGEGVTPAEYEEFFGGLAKSISSVAGDIARAGQKVAPGVATIAQGAMQGGAAGSALGPWGALGGALVGATGAGLRQYGSGGARTAGNVLGQVVGTAGQLTGRGAMPGMAGGLAGLGAKALAGRRPEAGQLLGAGLQLLGSRSPGAAQLIHTLGRPQTRQALAALAAGHNPAIPLGAGRPPIPANAFAGLLAALAREAEAESLAWGSPEAVPAYLVDSEGHLLADPREPGQRAGRVLQLLYEFDESDAESEAWDEAESEIEAEAFDAYGDDIEWWAA